MVLGERRERKSVGDVIAYESRGWFGGVLRGGLVRMAVRG